MANYAAPTERMSFFDVMIKAYTGPSTANFHRLARNPGANAGTAYLWVAVAAAVSSLISSLLFQVFPRNPMLEYFQNYGGDWTGQFDFGRYVAPTMFNLVITLICGIPIAAVVAVIFFAIATGLLHLIAGLFGGRGEYGQLAFLLAAIQVPITLITSILAPIPYLGCITFLLSLYVFVLQVLAIEGTYQFGIGKAVLTLLVPVIVVCLIVICIVAGIAAFLIPVIRENFNGTFPMP